MLTVKNLSVWVKNKKILHNVSYVFDKPGIYVLMGPNGSGKSTFALSLMGHTDYTIDAKTRIIYNLKHLTKLSPDKRAKKGIFLSFQSPPVLTGVTVFQLLRIALDGKIDPYELYQSILKHSKKLQISKEILDRPLHAGASGGERKKLEMLQAGILNPGVVIFDEIDTGVDVDAIKTFSAYIKDNFKNSIVIFITHNLRIFRYITPYKVLVMKKGTIIRSGGIDLIKTIEQKGFEPL